MQRVCSGKEFVVRLESYQINLCALGVGSQNSIRCVEQGSYRGAANRYGAANVCFGNGSRNDILEDVEGIGLVREGLVGGVMGEGVSVPHVSVACRTGGREQQVRESKFAPLLI